MKFLLFLALFPLVLSAQLELEVSTADASDSRARVEIKAKNSGDKGVRNARLVVMMMNDEGKVVGTHSQWLHNPNDPKAATAETVAIKAGEERDFNVVVKTKSKATQSKIICSRMVYADGSLANPSKDFKVTAAK